MLKSLIYVNYEPDMFNCKNILINDILFIIILSILELTKNICQGFQHSFWTLSISGSMQLLEEVRKQGNLFNYVPIYCFFSFFF